MGVNLTPIMVKRILTLNQLRGRNLAVDASNYLYQFLALIRTKDGTPLKDSRGNITSHLAGLMFRSTRLLCDFNIDLIFVFDGKPPALKQETIRERRKQRDRAVDNWQKALQTEDYDTAFSKAVMTSRLTKNMREDAKKLLSLLGIPCAEAPSEAEAQIAFMAKQGDVWAASSKDYDTLLFGTPRLLRFLTISGQEYLPSKGVSRPIEPELITTAELLDHHRITRAQLVDLAILIGTDFNEGVKGVGPKTALKLVQKHGAIEKLPIEVRTKITSQYREIREIFLNPPTTSDYDLTYRPFQEKELFRFLCDERDFSPERVETIACRMREFHRFRQSRLEKWFT
ncbi:MAG: flap endonuclease-1 [Candidatus Bathyarchaeota archaeon]|nr:MAG: flap endonuclease-1 [Candidatus Bathyarchaeota archaeon]